MNGGQHVMTGIILGTVTKVSTGLYFASFSAYPSYYLGIVVGSLLPDIDHKQSTIGRRLPFISEFLQKKLGHRGFTHSLLSLGLFLLSVGPYWYANPFLCVGLVIGYLSHLFGDMCTPSGIPLLYPNKKRYSFRKKKNKK